MVKIVHINATDNRGGASIACSRHSEAMNKAGMVSNIVTANHPKGFQKILQSLYFRINLPREKKLHSSANFSLMDFGMPLYRNPIVRNADIIYLHWVCANTLSIDGIVKILKLGKPTFWYMHDMFPFTGGCHYAFDCNGYKKGCLNCPQIGNESLKYKAQKQLLEKISKWGDFANLEFVSPSEWEARCAMEASLCNGHKIHIAPNLLDTSIFCPLENRSKQDWGLDPNKLTVLFGAARISSPYKGAKYVRECLQWLDPDRYEGLVMGKADNEFISDLPIKVVQTGFLYDETSIVKAYNACDTFITSSQAESFGQVVAEAMACGKPCVGFPTGGITDLIKHKENGYLTNFNSAAELRNGIEWLFSDKARYNSLSENARNHINDNFSYHLVLEKHPELWPYI